MMRLMHFLRYLLVVLPGAFTLYDSDRIVSEPRYMLSLLVLLLYMQQRDFRLEPSTASRVLMPYLLIELLGISYLAYQYGGLLPVVFLSALVSIKPRTQHVIVHMALAGVLMNLSAAAQMSWMMIVTLNMAFVAVAVLTYMDLKLIGNQQKIERLYDELRVKHYDLEEARRTVIDYAKKVQELAQNEERNRIAHDLHDDLGHKLIRLKMMLEAALRLDDSQREQSTTMVTEVKEQLGTALESLRATVRRLKPDQAVTEQYALSNLISQFARESGVKVRYDIVGMPYPLYPSYEFILYRNAQEAITNAIRHGEATEVTITLDYAPEELRMTVRNNGILPEAGAKVRRGLGLQGMEERVRVVGGSLTVTAETEFEVQTVLPRRSVEVSG